MRNSDREAFNKNTVLGLIWMSSSKFIQAILQILLMIILARFLSPVDFGIIAAAMIIISFSDIFSQLGIGQALVQREHIDINHIRTSVSVSFISGFFLCALVYFLSPVITDFFRMDEKLTIVLKVFSFLFPLKTVSFITESLVQRDMKFKILGNINTISFVFYAISGFIFAILDYGYWALVIATYVSIIVKSVILYYFQPHSLKLKINLNSLKELSSFGAGFSIARIFEFVSLQGDNIIVSKYLGASALGIYSRAYQLMASPVVLMGQVLDKVLFPTMSKIQKDLHYLSYIYKKGINLTTILILPLTIYIFIFSKEIVYVLLGSKWDDVEIPFKIFALAIFFRIITRLADSIIKALGEVNKRAWLQGGYALLIIIFSFLGKENGVFGVSLGVLVATIIHSILTNVLSMNLLKLKFREILPNHTFILSCIVLLVIIYSLKSCIYSKISNPFFIFFVSLVTFFFLMLIIFLINFKFIFGDKVNKRNGVEKLQ